MSRPQRDTFFWLLELDRASTVMTQRSGIVSHDVATRAAGIINRISSEAEQPGAKRPTDYLGVIALLRPLDPDGDTTQIHLGRSRQDMLATVHRLLLRDRVLTLLDLLLTVRGTLLRVAERHLHDVVPAYTNGVQAQPITFGHQMLGYEATLQRATRRFLESYPRLNRCPLGVAALATSSFPVDRHHLANLLGFDGPEMHAFDAGQLAVIDIGFEQAANAMGMALSLGTLIQDIHAQYHHVRPWILLGAQDLLAPSTLMPQKRNPVALNRARLLASEVVGDGVSTAFAAHNVPSGLTDYKRAEAATTLDRGIALLTEMQAILSGLAFDAEAALNELWSDWSTASELANVLQRDAAIPFHIGHEFVSALVTAARSRQLGAGDTPYALIAEVWAQAIGGIYPLSENRTREALHPATMVRHYCGLGGPQPDEVSRLLTCASAALSADRASADHLVNAAQAADRARHEAFGALCVSP